MTVETAPVLDENKSSAMADFTPKRSSAVVQPIPRRLVQTTPYDLTKQTIKIEKDFDFRNTENTDMTRPNLLMKDLGSSVSYTQSTIEGQKQTMQKVPRRVTAFSVMDLLGGNDSTKDKSPPHHVVFQPMQLPLQRGVPASHMEPIHQEMPLPLLKETTSPIGPSRSLTSSPESPKSDTSVSDRSDPNSSTDPDISPLFRSSADKKSNRTNYTPVQVRRLEKIFLETPYPEHEVYEQLSKDLSIPEPRLKVWFQNKRARWKRKAEDKLTQSPTFTLPMMPGGFPFGMMPGTMTSQTESPNPAMHQYPFGHAHPGLMMYPGVGYPAPLYPYLSHQMYAQQ